MSTACQGREIGSKPISSETLVFSDDFEREAIGQDWKRGVGESGRGTWRIVDGQIDGRGLKNDPLWLTKPIPENAKITFNATALTPEGDIKVELYGDGKQHASGYVFIFGGWKNSLDVIARLDEHGKDRVERKSVKVKPNVTYAMEIMRRGGELTWKVDGKSFPTFKDAAPLTGERHGYFAFSNWSAPVRFDNFKVYKLP